MLNKFWSNMSLTVRITWVLLVLIAGSMALFVGARTAMAASLKNVSIINDDTLKLGDIFDGVERNGDYVIGPAPQPGQDMVLNARTLYRIAVALDLPWRPASSSDQIIIRREATIVSYETIEKALREQLQTKGVNGHFNVALNNGRPTMILSNNVPENVEISALSYDTQKDYFQATLVAPSHENPQKQMVVTGLVERMATVPVLRSNLRNGDIIGANDIEIINVPQKKLQHNVIMDKEKLIGMTPRRVAYAGKFVLAGTLERPQLVGRGDKVSITYNTGSLILTAKGKALQSGAKGDLIRVTNSNSSRTVDAVVMGENRVIVQ